MEIKKQGDVNDCGLVVLQALHKYLHKKWININELKSRAYMDAKGINISNLVSLGKRYGVELDPLSGKVEDLFAIDTKEFLISMIKVKEANHYVIIKVLKNKVIIWDPVSGKYNLTKEEFAKVYQGIIMTFKQFHYEPTYLRKMSWFVLKEPVLVLILIVSILVSILVTFVSSIYMKVILDKIIPQKLNKELIVISLVFIWLGSLKAFNIFVKKYFSRKLSLHINYELTFLYMAKLSSSKLNDLDKVTKSDHLRRIALIEGVSNFISNIMFIIFGDTVMMFVSVGILFWLSVKLLGIVIITSVLSIAITTVFNIFIKEEYDNTINLQHGALASNIEFISSYEKLKEPDYHRYVKNKFRNNYENYKKSESKIFWFKTTSLTWESLLDVIVPIVITYFASKLVFGGELTIGSMVMFVSLFRTFLHPLDSIATTLMNMPIGYKNLNLLKYIFMLENEVLNEKGFISKSIKTITLKNIDFGFDKSIFKLKELKLDKNIKLKGKNGIGKTSLMKLLSCRYDYEGQYFLNDIELDFLNKKDLRNRIYFSSDEFIPDVTIFEYITLLDPLKAKIFSENIDKYNLNNLFQLIDIDLSKTLQQNGSNVSSGQMQVIKLLRLLTKQYDLILLDEATDNITSDILKIITKPILKYQNGIFVEISHNDKYITKGGEVNFAKVIQS